MGDCAALTPIGLSIQKGLPASIAARAVSCARSWGRRWRPRQPRDPRAGHGSLRTRDQTRGRREHLRVRGGGEGSVAAAGCDLRGGEVLCDVGVGARVKSARPTQRDDTDAERLSCCQRLLLATLRGKRASALTTRVTIWHDKLWHKFFILTRAGQGVTSENG